MVFSLLYFEFKSIFLTMILDLFHTDIPLGTNQSDSPSPELRSIVDRHTIRSAWLLYHAHYTHVDIGQKVQTQPKKTCFDEANALSLSYSVYPNSSKEMLLSDLVEGALLCLCAF